MISVIIPVYNTEKYLSQCLDSVLNQTYTDLEILIIDDGSTDSSPHICDEYSDKDNRVKVWHRENRGVSASRNFGLSNCHGEWISFIDSDDWMDENMYLTMVEAAEQYKSDTVCCGHYNCDMNQHNLARTWHSYNEENFVCKKDGIFTRVLCNTSFLWDKLLNAEKARNVIFQENIRYGEDLLFLTKYFLNVENVAVVKEPLYFYRKYREGNLVSATINETLLDYLKAMKQVVDILNPQNEYYASVVLAARVLIKVLYRIPIFKIRTYKIYVEEAKSLSEKIKPIEHILLKTRKDINNVARKILLEAVRHTSRIAVIIAKLINRVQERS